MAEPRRDNSRLALAGDETPQAPANIYHAIQEVCEWSTIKRPNRLQATKLAFVFFCISNYNKSEMCTFYPKQTHCAGWRLA